MYVYSLRCKCGVSTGIPFTLNISNNRSINSNISYKTPDFYKIHNQQSFEVIFLVQRGSVTITREFAKVEKIRLVCLLDFTTADFGVKTNAKLTPNC